jgi:hypothetical protein
MRAESQPEFPPGPGCAECLGTPRFAGSGSLAKALRYGIVFPGPWRVETQGR